MEPLIPPDDRNSRQAQFDALMRSLHPVLDQMTKAAWLNGFGHGPTGPQFDWTLIGHQRMRDLVDMLNELCPQGTEEISKEDLGRIWAVVMLYKNRFPIG